MTCRVLVLSIVLAASGFPVAAPGQTRQDVEFLRTHNPLRPVLAQDLAPLPADETSELKLAMMGAIRFYQLFISTQDLPVCNFTPSCSRFGMKALRQYGVIYGSLMTSDRLQRCHGKCGDHYPRHPLTGKCDDPVENNAPHHD